MEYVKQQYPKGKAHGSVIAAPDWLSKAWNWVKGALTTAAVDLSAYGTARHVNKTTLFPNMDTDLQEKKGATAIELGVTIGGSTKAADASIEPPKDPPPAPPDSVAKPGLTLNRPWSPFGNTTRPTSADSVGWDHNEGVIATVAGISNFSSSEVYSKVIPFVVNSIGDSATVVNALTYNRFDSLLSLVPLNADSIYQVIAVFTTLGLSTEYDELAACADGIRDLYNDEYPVDAAFSLINSCQSGAMNLSIPQWRRVLLRDTFSVFKYSFALWLQRYDDL